MNEYNKIKEEITKLISQCYSQEYSTCKEHPIFQPQKFINMILDMDEIFIKADNQDLPDRLNTIYKNAGYSQGVKDMLNAGFVKVAKKEVKDNE